MDGEHIVDDQGMDDEGLANAYRDNRDLELRLSDWTQLSDVNQQIRYAYVSYRQALRDLPQHENWPQLTPDDWPRKPNL
jgi:hypothetical protein